MAKTVASDLIRNSDVLGLGSGSAVARFAKALGERVRKESLQVTVVPSSMQSWLLAKENKLVLASDSGHCPPIVDVAVDGADQISLSTRSIIKGGGGALLKEKIIISSAKKCYILADESKYVQKLNRSIPVEVTQFSVLSVERKMKEHLRAEPVLRKLDKGYPFFTESGNVILDCQFKEAISDPVELEMKIKTIPGVVEDGIFNNPVKKFYRVNQKGTFEAL
jgi:ribose 5-phosphate isomerase A